MQLGCKIQLLCSEPGMWNRSGGDESQIWICYCQSSDRIRGRSLYADSAVEADVLSPVKLLPFSPSVNVKVCVCCFTVCIRWLDNEEGRREVLTSKITLKCCIVVIHDLDEMYQKQKDAREFTSLLLHVFCFSMIQLNLIYSNLKLPGALHARA